MKCGTITMHSIIGSNRIDPSYHLSDAIWFRNLQNKLPYGNVHIKNVVEKVFLGNIFSRIFVKDKEHGIPLSFSIRYSSCRFEYKSVFYPKNNRKS